MSFLTFFISMSRKFSIYRYDRESGDYAGSISDLHSMTSRLSQVSVSSGCNCIIRTDFQLNFFSQIGTNNCTARYRTLSGGIGGSPSPTHSSDYVDDDDEDDEDDLTTNTAVLNGLANSATNSTIATSVTSASNIMKPKRNSLASHLHKSSTISHQKATVHFVSNLIFYRKLEKSNNATQKQKELL